MYKNLSEVLRRLLCLIAEKSFYQSTVFLYNMKVVAAIHSTMDTVFFKKALAAMNCLYKMYLTGISI